MKRWRNQCHLSLIHIYPSFRVWTDEESNQTIIAGMGELHLDIIVDRMKREFNVEAVSYTHLDVYKRQG